MEVLVELLGATTFPAALIAIYLRNVIENGPNEKRYNTCRKQKIPSSRGEIL